MKFSANISTLFQDIATIGERYIYLVQECSTGFDAIECQNPFQLSLSQWQEIFNKCLGSLWNRGKTHLPKWDLINSEPIFEHFNSIPPFNAYHDKILLKTLRYAEFLDCSKVHLVMTDVLNDNGYKANQSKIINLLQKSARFFAQENISCVIEPLSIRDNYYLKSYSEAQKVIKAVNEPNLKILLDIYHMQRLDGNLTDKIEIIKDDVGHVQISQVPLRDSPFNDGEVNYRYVLRLISEFYRGYVGLEYKSETKDSLEWTKDYLHL